MNAFASAAGKPRAKTTATPSAPVRTAASAKVSAYLIGAVCGAALAFPLAALPLGAVALGVGPSPVPVAAQGPALPAFQAHQVNRASKGARLDLHLSPSSTGVSMMAKTASPDISVAARAPLTREGDAVVAGEAGASPMAQGLPSAADKPIRASRPPKGCSSTLGPVARLATDEITVCVASLS